MDIYFFKDLFPPSSHLWQLEELEELFVIDSAPLGLLIREKYEREAGRQAAEICFLLAVNSTGEMHPKRRCCVSYIFFIFSGIVKENCVCTLALRAELLPEASILGTNRRRAVRTADVQTDDPIIISSFKCCSWILRTLDN